MANQVLLPGYGGMFTSADVGSTSTYVQTQGTDLTIDLSMVDRFAIQITSTTASPTGTIQLEQSFNKGLSYSNLGSSINVATDVVTLFDLTAGPFGQIKINATGILSGSVNCSIVGYHDY